MWPIAKATLKTSGRSLEEEEKNGLKLGTGKKQNFSRYIKVKENKEGTSPLPI